MIYQYFYIKKKLKARGDELSASVVYGECPRAFARKT